MSWEGTAKDRTLKQWGARIVSQLPPNDDDSRQVLRYASDLLEEFLAHKPAKKARRRAAS